MRLISSNSQAQIYHAVQDGREWIVKTSANPFLLQSEAAMLAHLRPHIRVPDVYDLTPNRLEMEYIPHDGSCDAACEAAIAEALVHLHDQTADTFGFTADTTIGPFRQRNTPHLRWIDFFREVRILGFAREMRDEGRLDAALMDRLERFAASFDAYLLEPERPALLHGDVWSGNVLTHRNRPAALIDPALYYGHPEMELAFIGMFHTFGPPFYARYQALRPLPPGFFETRAPIYRLYPYLVHVRAFGGSYRRGLEGILAQFGY